MGVPKTDPIVEAGLLNEGDEVKPKKETPPEIIETAPENVNTETPRIQFRDYEQEARDRVIQQRLDEQNKTLRNESLYGDLPPEAFNQPPTLAETMGAPKTDPIVEAGLLTPEEAKATPSPTTKKI